MEKTYKKVKKGVKNPENQAWNQKFVLLWDHYSGNSIKREDNIDKRCNELSLNLDTRL